jgi:hypothetical protein
MLSAEQLKVREGKLTGSQMNIVMSGDEAKILNLWRDLVGDPAYIPDDLSKIWPVRLGEATEALNLEWYALKHNPISRMGEVVIDGWKAATLDGFDAKLGIPVECKCVNGRSTMEQVIARYSPQTHWQMIVTGARKCALSVIIGGAEPVVDFIPYDSGYGALLIANGRTFLDCVENLVPPVEMRKVEPPPLPSKSYDMSGDEKWKQLADRWVQAYGAAATAKAAESAIKVLVPADAQKAFGCGIVVTRNRAGSLSLREIKEQANAK